MLITVSGSSRGKEDEDEEDGENSSGDVSFRIIASGMVPSLTELTSTRAANEK